MKRVPHLASTVNEQTSLYQSIRSILGERIPIDTARRVSEYWREFSNEDNETQISAIMSKQFDCDHDEIVLVKDIPYQSICEHHLLPFFGVIHIAYIPQGKVLGLSKFGRLVDYFSKRPQLQERLTGQIGQKVVEYLNPLGVFVIAEGTHTCMVSRGILKQGSTTKTSYVFGVFKEDVNARQEVLNLL